jgi:hypothetical protein
VVEVDASPAAGAAWACEVQVDQGGRRSHHTVSVSAAELARWGTGTSRADVERLVRRSFEFLLEREPPESILRRFELSVIESYFPEYDELIRGWR